LSPNTTGSKPGPAATLKTTTVWPIGHFRTSQRGKSPQKDGQFDTNVRQIRVNPLI
jgi:hypothetical protein